MKCNVEWKKKQIEVARIRREGERSLRIIITIVTFIIIWIGRVLVGKWLESERERGQSSVPFQFHLFV